MRGDVLKRARAGRGVSGINAQKAIAAHGGGDAPVPVQIGAPGDAAVAVTVPHRVAIEAVVITAGLGLDADFLAGLLAGRARAVGEGLLTGVRVPARALEAPKARPRSRVLTAITRMMFTPIAQLLTSLGRAAPPGPAKTGDFAG